MLDDKQENKMEQSILWLFKLVCLTFQSNLVHISDISHFRLDPHAKLPQQTVCYFHTNKALKRKVSDQFAAQEI